VSEEQEGQRRGKKLQQQQSNLQPWPAASALPRPESTVQEEALYPSTLQHPLQHVAQLHSSCGLCSTLFTLRLLLQQ
jgi:hypothetical protein